VNCECKSHNRGGYLAKAVLAEVTNRDGRCYRHWNEQKNVTAMKCLGSKIVVGQEQVSNHLIFCPSIFLPIAENGMPTQR
jgi:hypothetical protein